MTDKREWRYSSRVDLNGFRLGLLAGALLLLPAGALPAAAPSNGVPVEARIQAFRGKVRIEGAYLMKVGAKVGEGTRILTGPNSSVSLRLPDASIVTLPSMSTIRIIRLRRIGRGNVYDRRFVLEAGRSEYQVTPNHKDGSRFDVQTPVSVAAVRGTIFRVSLPADGGANAEVLRGNVAVAGHTDGINLPQGFGAHADSISAGIPVRLLSAPRIQSVQDTELGPETVLIVPVPGAHSYHVQLAKDKAFTALLDENSGPKPRLAIKPTAVGLFYLRVTALDADGLEGMPNWVTYHHDAPGK